jgi:hypothetical protein
MARALDARNKSNQNIQVCVNAQMSIKSTETNLMERCFSGHSMKSLICRRRRSADVRWIGGKIGLPGCPQRHDLGVGIGKMGQMELKE